MSARSYGTGELQEITTVTIPIPQPFQRNFGVHATSHSGAIRCDQRYAEEDWKLILKHATKLEISKTAFIKESAINMAKALEAKEKHREQQHNLRSG